MPSSIHCSGASLPKEWWEKNKEKEKDDIRKSKGKNPAYKLQYDIKTSIDMKIILEEKILDVKIEFTPGTALSIVKKDFYELIINVIKKKKQIIAEAIIIEELNIQVTMDDKEKIKQIFA